MTPSPALMPDRPDLEELISVLEAIQLVIRHPAATLLDRPIPALVLNTHRGAEAAYLFHAKGWPVREIAHHQGLSPQAVRRDLERWARGPVDARWRRLASSPARRGYVALLTAHLRPSTAFTQTYAALAATFDVAEIRAESIRDACWSDADRRLLAHALGADPTFARAQDAHVVGGLHLLRGRPLEPLAFEETAPDPLLALAQAGRVAGIDATFVATADRLVTVVLMSVGYPATVATAVIGRESGSTARFALRLLARKYRAVPDILVFDQHGAYADRSFLLEMALLGIEPYHPRIIAENPVEALNARVKAHLPEADLLTAANIGPAIHAACQSTNREPARLGSLRALRPLSPGQLHLLEYSEFDLAWVEGGCCEVDGRSLPCEPPDPSRPLLVAIRGRDRERSRPPVDADLFDVGVDLAPGAGRPHLGVGVSRLTRVASTTAWLSPGDRRREVLAHLDQSTLARLSKEGHRWFREHRPPADVESRRQTSPASAGAEALPLAPTDPPDDRSGSAGAAQPGVDGGSRATPPTIDPVPVTAKRSPSQSCPTASVDLAPSSQDDPRPVAVARRLVLDIALDGAITWVPATKAVDDAAVDVAHYRAWAEECPWAFAKRYFYDHRGLRQLCEARGRLRRAHPVRLLVDPAVGYEDGVPIADGLFVYFRPARRRTSRACFLGVAAPLLQALRSLLGAPRPVGDDARALLATIGKGLTVAADAREIGTAAVVRERLGRVQAALERAELACLQGDVAGARDQLRYARTQVPVG